MGAQPRGRGPESPSKVKLLTQVQLGVVLSAVNEVTPEYGSFAELVERPARTTGPTILRQKPIFLQLQSCP